MVLNINNYDDLQRFREKTQTQSLKFKNLSSEAASGKEGDWVILNQLIPVVEESSFAMGGLVSLSVPELVSADMFHRVENAPIQTISASQLVVLAVAAPEPSMVSAPKTVPAMDMFAPTTEGFAHLFAAKAVEPDPVPKYKDQLLKSLLHRIATCR